MQYSQSPAQRFCGGVVPASTWSERHRLILLPRPSSSGRVFWQSPVRYSCSGSALSSCVSQTHGTPVVQSTDPTGGFFGRARPPIIAKNSLVFGSDVGSSVQMSIERSSQCSSHDDRQLPRKPFFEHLVGFFSTFFEHLDFWSPAEKKGKSVGGGAWRVAG